VKSAGTRRSYGIASLPCGRRTKYLVVVFWLVVVAVTGGLDTGRWMWWPSGLVRQPAGQERITPVSATALR
jgi:hypothetical protein